MKYPYQIQSRYKGDKEWNTYKHYSNLEEAKKGIKYVKETYESENLKYRLVKITLTILAC